MRKMPFQNDVDDDVASERLFSGRHWSLLMVWRRMVGTIGVIENREERRDGSSEAF